MEREQNPLQHHGLNRGEQAVLAAGACIGAVSFYALINGAGEFSVSINNLSVTDANQLRGSLRTIIGAPMAIDGACFGAFLTRWLIIRH